MEEQKRKIQEEVNTNFLFNSSLSQMKQKTKESTPNHMHNANKQANKKATGNNFSMNKPEHIS